jgi:hypothetical protein
VTGGPSWWRRTAAHVARQAERTDEAPERVPPRRVDDFARVVAAMDDGLADADAARERVARALDTRVPTYNDTLDVLAADREPVEAVCDRAGVDPDGLAGALAAVDAAGTDDAREQRRWVVWNHLGERDDDERRALERSLRGFAWRHDDRPVQPFGWSRVGRVADHLGDRLGLDAPAVGAALRLTLFDRELVPPEVPGGADERAFEAAREVLDRPVADEEEPEGEDTAASLVAEFEGRLPVDDDRGEAADDPAARGNEDEERGAAD